MALLLFYLFYILFYFHVRQFLVRSCIFKVYYVGRYAGVWIEQHFQVQSFKVKMETTQLLSLTSHLMYSVCVCNNAARTCFAHETETYCKPHLHIALMFQILSCNIFAVSGEKYDMTDIFYSAMNLAETMLYMRYITDISEPKYPNFSLAKPCCNSVTLCLYVVWGLFLPLGPSS